MSFKNILQKIRKKNNKDSSLTSSESKALTVRKRKGKESYITIEREDKVKPEKYYADKAKIFGFARYAATAILVVFILAMFSFFGDEFTSENFRYLLKHIDMNSSGVIDEFKTVVYDSAEGTVFCEYQQDFVIAAPGSLKIYDYKGSMTLNSLPNTEKPRICSSERYILLYDRGDSDYYVYNSFSLLRHRDLENNIITADISDSGAFVIVTESLEYAAHIYVYNDGFELINEIKKNNTVSDVCLSDDGTKLAVSSFDISENAEITSTITVYQLSESKVIFEKSIKGELPVSIEFDNEDGVNVLTNQKIRFYDENGDEYTYNLQQSSVSLFASSDDLFVYSAMSDLGINDNTVYIVDAIQNKMVGKVKIDKKIISLGVGGEYAFVLTEDTLYRVDKNGISEEKQLESPVCMVISPTGNVFICYESRAEFIKF